jgi:RNA polymerase sigma-70 factor, ECF subfamily
VSAHSSQDVTQLLRAWNRGEKDALEKPGSLVYDELHRLARRYMAGERPGRTQQTTALLNEAYLRLVDSPDLGFKDRTCFFCACAQVMRRIWVDPARQRRALKCGADVHPFELEEPLLASREFGADLVALDALALVDPLRPKAVELRFFGGMSVQETAEVLKISAETVMHNWNLAKSWFQLRVEGGTCE